MIMCSWVSNKFYKKIYIKCLKGGERELWKGGEREMIFA